MTLLYGDPTSEIGIITLWTPTARFAPKIDKQNYQILGQLFSRSQGISMLIRTCMKTKAIRHIVIVGVDMNKCSDALLALGKNGVDSKHLIIDCEQSVIEKEIPFEAIETFRKNVKIHDCRKMVFSELNTFLASLPKQGTYGEGEEFPPPKVNAYDTFPSELSGMGVCEEFCHEAWLKQLHNVARFGIWRDDEKVMFNAVCTVTEDDPEKLRMPSHLSMSEADINVDLNQCALQVEELEGEVYLTATVPKIDAYELLKLLFALRKHHGTLGKPASLTLIAHSITLKRADFDKAKTLLKDKPMRLKAFVPDQRGNILIDVQESIFLVTHQDPFGNPIDMFEAKTAKEEYSKLALNNTLYRKSHIYDIGCELQKAEIALNEGITYKQDNPLIFK